MRCYGDGLKVHSRCCCTRKAHRPVVHMYSVYANVQWVWSAEARVSQAFTAGCLYIEQSLSLLVLKRFAEDLMGRASASLAQTHWPSS